MRDIKEVFINGGITLEEILDKHEKWLKHENRWEECSTGIHFFLTRDEAVNY